MSEPAPLAAEELFTRLPPVWPDEGLRQQIAAENARRRRCVVALDDDPTGTQTVHDVWVLTRWEVDDLRSALKEDEAAIYILTNSRSLPLAEAEQINRQVAVNLAAAAQAERRRLLVISRSDSTLRGHFPGEVDALSKALSQAEGVRFDGICLLPFFLEGGRFTIGDIHWVQEGERLIPAAQTPYAQDPVFGYRHSRLPEWVEEKTGGRVKAEEVISISLETLRRGGPAQVASQLCAAQNATIIAVNAASERDVEVFVCGLFQAEEQGRRFLCRSAASLVKIAAGLTDKPLLTPAELVSEAPPCGGLIVFGSYVPKSTAQLEALLRLEGLRAIELKVSELLDGPARPSAIEQASLAANEALADGKDVVLFTSRAVVSGRTRLENLAIGRAISTALMQTVQGIRCRPRFVVGKGGITSSELATQGMNVRAARVLGQVLPGVPVWKPGPGSRWPGITYVVFPGNVGDDQAVARVVQMLRNAG